MDYYTETAHPSVEPEMMDHQDRELEVMASDWIAEMREFYDRDERPAEFRWAEDFDKR